MAAALTQFPATMSPRRLTRSASGPATGPSRTYGTTSTAVRNDVSVGDRLRWYMRIGSATMLTAVPAVLTTDASR
jgi:hypothetical protein